MSSTDAFVRQPSYYDLRDYAETWMQSTAAKIGVEYEREALSEFSEITLSQIKLARETRDYAELGRVVYEAIENYWLPIARTHADEECEG